MVQRGCWDDFMCVLFDMLALNTKIISTQVSDWVDMTGTFYATIATTTINVPLKKFDTVP